MLLFQKLLLEDLNATRACNTLLVPEADEDVRWVNDKMLGIKGKPKADGRFQTYSRDILMLIVNQHLLW